MFRLKEKAPPVVKVIGAQYLSSQVLKTREYEDKYHPSQKRSVTFSEYENGNVTIVLFTKDGELKQRTLRGKWTLEQVSNMTKSEGYF